MSKNSSVSSGVTDVTNAVTPDIVMKLLTQNQEFKELMMEQSKQLLDQQEENKLLFELFHS